MPVTLTRRVTQKVLVIRVIQGYLFGHSWSRVSGVIRVIRVIISNAYHMRVIIRMNMNIHERDASCTRSKGYSRGFSDKWRGEFIRVIQGLPCGRQGRHLL